MRYTAKLLTCKLKLYTDKNDFMTSANGEHNHNTYNKLNVSRRVVNKNICEEPHAMGGGKL